jgi:CRP-like cAMP-binding protein
MASRRIELLRGMAVFGGVREDILELVLRIAPTRSVPEGTWFFREGEHGDTMFVLERGRVAVLRARHGHDEPVRELAAGDCFGEMALMDLAPRSASVRALEDCVAIEISAACLAQIYEADLEQFALIEMNMGREVSRRLREADRRLFGSD